MAGWMQVALPRSDAEWKLLQDSFEEVFTVAGGPRQAAMYADRDTAGKVQITFYFSPAAADLFRSAIHLHHGVSAERPSANNISLLVGHQQAIDPLWAENPS